MSMTLRLEQTVPNKTLIASLNREKERILQDELLAQRILQLQTEAKINLKAEWSESLEEASQRKRMRQDRINAKSELSYANKALTAVRRAALRDLLERDHNEYEKELHAIGRAFYVKRV